MIKPKDIRVCINNDNDYEVSFKGVLKNAETRDEFSYTKVTLVYKDGIEVIELIKKLLGTGD